jgi:DNA polymerase III epsilon subunit-like protein
VNTHDFLVVDTETSGTDILRHEILEIAAVRFAPDLTTEKAILHRKCRMMHIELADPEALKINRYSPEAWAKAFPIRVALVDFATVAGGDPAIWVGHNPSFDEAFLKVAFAREQLAFPRFRYLWDTLSMAAPLYLRGDLDKMGLDHLCSKYGISNEGKHTAMADVRRTVALLKKLVGRT